MGEKKTFPVISIIVVGAVMVYLSYSLVHVLTPFVLSCAIAYIVNPIVTHFEIQGMRRNPIVVMGYVLVGLLVSVLVTQLLPLAHSEWILLQAQIPDYVSRTRDFFGGLPLRIAQSLPTSTMVSAEQVEVWSKSLYDPLVNQIQFLPTYILGLFPLLSLLFLIPFISFFLLCDGHKYISGMIQACPSRYVEQVLYFLSEIDTSLGNYLRGIFIEALAVTVAACIALSVIGVNYALAIGIMAGLSSLVPYLGAAMGALVGGLIALFQFGTLGAAFKVIMVFAAIRFVDDWLLQPIISKYSVHLHPLIFLLSLMVGGHVLGVIGLVFAVPAACVVKSLVKVAWDWYSSEALRDDYQHVDTGLTPYT